LRPTIHSPAIRVYVRPELPDVGVSVHGMVGYRGDTKPNQ
jgi:hypothetical protein